MARRKNKQVKQEEETLINVVERVETAQDYVEQNANKIMSIIGVIVIIIVAVAVYFNFYKKPRDIEAAKMIQYAQFNFDNEKYAIALDGDTINTDHGFLDIIDNYGSTKSANLANYYAGISYLNLGNYKVAIDYLNKFSDKGRVLGAFKYAALGDAYSELEDMDKALSNYRKAVSSNPNEFSTPIHLLKLAFFLENQGQGAEAKEMYQKIKDEYPNSSQAIDAKKYLARLGE